MTSLTQVLLVVVIGVLTVLLVVAGIQVVNILREIRWMVAKMNRILDDVADLTHSVTQPVVSLSGLVEGLKGGVRLVAVMRKILGKNEEEEGGEVKERQEEG
ncbi:MAG: hypothetical protein HY381_00205 [Candidatus Chisholmbacteria bacterium]|nr:hypothetical protein [Candidatus Chisholmbacteria bacterium]